jgi:DedD protein
MSHLFEDDDDLPSGRDREVTLSTAAILGLFFGLVLVCGVFFAFGYSMGKHRTAPVPTDADTAGAPGPSTNFNSFKPAAGSPVGSASVAPAPAVSSKPASSPANTYNTSPARSSPPPVITTASETASPQQPAPIVRTSTPPASLVESANGIANPSGSFMVQVAAVSHQEDADLLESALKSRGYAVVARPSPSDALIHIQVGPFNNRRDADTMRNRLLTDGYNAIVK